MPSLSTSPDAGLAPDTDTAFEDALERLESIVRDMESDQVPLSRLIEYYEEGNRLHQTCQRLLDAARGRIEVIRDRGRAGVVLEALGAGASAGASVGAEVAEAPPATAPPSAGRTARRPVEEARGEELF